jgi:squalene synthase HpnC
MDFPLPASPPPRPPQAARREPAAWEIAAAPTGGDLAAAEAYCRALAAGHYENFTVATRLVPPRLRQHLANVYAFARHADDIVDETADPAAAARALADWREGLAACFAGRPGHPVFVALADTVRRTGLGPEPFRDLLDAFDEDRRYDAAGATVRYGDRAAVTDYCRRSADPVGRIVLGLEGCRDADLVAMSDAICTGLQLVNFWQDIRRDRLAGRVYIPRDDLARHGVVPEDLDAPAAAPRLRALVADLVGWARDRFAAGAGLPRLAPPALRPAVTLFLAGGRALADAIERSGFDTLARRPTVGRMTKLRLATRAWLAAACTPDRGGAGR